MTGGEDRGTGLGLSLVYAIVTDLAGAIDVKSAPNQGSAFAVYLPLAEVVPATADQTEGSLPRRNGERMLLVSNESRLSHFATAGDPDGPHP